MKQFVLALLFFGFSTFLSYAQSPQAFKYQAVARDASGTILADQSVAFRISILEGNAAGTALYTETHASTTNNMGLVNLEIGIGTVVTGVFADISWGGNSYFLQVELDEAGGTNYQVMGTTQLLSVPYSLHSETTSDNTRWIKNADDLYYLDGDVGIGTVTPEESALLDLNSNSKGFLPPRMTTQQMESLSNPVEGLVVYNYDQKSLCWFDGIKWIYTDGAKHCGEVSYGGQTYQTIYIGTQCWMTKSLDIGIMINGSEQQTQNTPVEIIEKYCYNDLEINCNTYGGLYQWNEMMQYSIVEGTQGICPDGWHIPTDNEFTTLVDYLGGGTYAGGQMKETGFDHWISPNGGATNQSGFIAIPAGFRDFDGLFGYMGYLSTFWSSTLSNPNFLEAWKRRLNNADAEVNHSWSNTTNGFSIRCLKN